MAKLFARLAVVITAVILFSGVAYLGLRFIEDVSESASQIEAKVLPPNELSISLDQNIGSDTALTQTASFPFLQAADDSISNGQDISISAGELAYQQGQPKVRLALHNDGGFTVSKIFVQLTLHLDNASKNIGQPVVLPITLETPLAAGQSTQSEIIVPDEMWRDKIVQEARVRHVVAKIVAVSDHERGDIDYPQISEGVLVRQIANDWQKPAETKEPMGVVLNETASQVVAGSPNIEVQADKPVARTRLLPPDPDDVSEFLEPPLPTGKTRIISVEIEEYQNGELIRAQSTSEKE